MVKVLIGIAVLVADAVTAVMTPAIYSLYFCEEATVIVMVLEDWLASNSAKLANVNVVFPVTVMLFLLLGPLLRQTLGNAGSICALTSIVVVNDIKNRK